MPAKSKGKGHSNWRNRLWGAYRMMLRIEGDVELLRIRTSELDGCGEMAEALETVRAGIKEINVKFQEKVTYRYKPGV